MKIYKRVTNGDYLSLIEAMECDCLENSEVEWISHQLTSASRRCGGAAEGLREVSAHYRGPHTPAFRRFAVHYFDSIWVETKGRKEKREALEKAITEWRHGDIPAVNLFRGALELEAGNRDSGFSLMAKAAEDSDDPGLPRMYLGAYSIKLDSEWSRSKVLPEARPISWPRSASKRGQLCVMLASDSRYYERFAPYIHASLRAHDAESNIHFHVVNWNKECSRASGFAFSDPLVSISAEPWPYRRDFAYFATARFYRAAEIMRAVDQPLYITDIDNTFTQSPSSILPLLSAESVGFRYHVMGEWFPWMAPSGGNLWLRNDDGGLRVADLLHNYVAHRFQVNSRRSWWFDQLTLNEVRYRVLQDGIATIELSNSALSASVARPYEDVKHLKAK